MNKLILVEFSPFDILNFSNEVDWKNAVQTSGFDLVDWDTNAGNVAQASELGGVTLYWDAALGSHLTYDKVTPDSLSFEITNTGVVPGNIFGLIYWDRNEGFPEGTIGIGDIDNYENDDFEIVQNTLKVFAFAFEIGDNVFSSDEVMEVAAIDPNSGNEVMWKEFQHNEMAPFIGLISPIPIGRISFNESPDGDDIYIKDFKFGISK